MRSKILGSALIAALLPGAAGASDGAPAAAGVYWVQRAEPGSAPLALVIVNDHDAVVVAAEGAAADAVVRGVRGITAKPVSIVVSRRGPDDEAGDAAVYRREFPGVLVRSPRDELTLFRGERTIHLTSLAIWLPEEGIVVDRDLVPALSP